MSVIEDFLRDVDASWRWTSAPRIRLRIIGSAFELEVLEIVDVVVSKLKRFNRDDVNDVSAMVHKGLVPHAKLVDRFRAAVDLFSCDARADELPRYVRNLHRLERDGYGAAGTLIELPEWI